MKQHNTKEWAFATLGVTASTTLIVLCFLILFAGTFSSIANIEFITKTIASIVLVEILYLGIKNMLQHEDAENRKTSIAKKIIGWAIIVIAIIFFILSAISNIWRFVYFMDVAKQYSTDALYYMYYKPSIDSEIEYSLSLLSGVQIIFPGLMLVWGYYIKKSGPLYSPKWKRWVKVVLYILVTLIILVNIATPSIAAWISVVIVYILMMIIVAMKTEYVDPSKQQIIEDINL